MFINRCFACLMIMLDVCYSDLEVSVTLFTLSVVFSCFLNWLFFFFVTNVQTYAGNKSILTD